MSEASKHPETQESPEQPLTLDDVPRITEYCKSLAVQYTNLMDTIPNKKSPDFKAHQEKVTAFVHEARKAPEMIETLYRILETRCRPHMYDLPGVGRKEVMEVKERVRAHVDPDAPEAREGGWVYLTDLPSLADRFAAVVAAFLELEKNPWKPGDDVEAALYRASEIFWEGDTAFVWFMGSVVCMCSDRPLDSPEAPEDPPELKREDANVGEEMTDTVKETTDTYKEKVAEEDIVKEDIVKEDIVKEDIVKEDIVKENMIKEDIVKENTEKDKMSKNKNPSVAMFVVQRFRDMKDNKDD